MNSDPAIEAALTMLRARRDDLNTAIAALENVNGVETAASVTGAASKSLTRWADRQRSSNKGGGVAGVKAILEATPSQGFTPDELAAAMLTNGWNADTQHPARAARAAANRLRDTAGSNVFLENGRFIYRPLTDTTREEGEGNDAAAL